MKKGGKYLIGVLLVAIAGCAGEEWQEGLRKTPLGTGPMVVWNLDARPFPDVPFPNDVATRLDPTSPTGRRVNVSTIASTKLESNVRKKLDLLSGFGIYAPISVSFEGPLDLDEIVKRHQQNDDFMDDAVLIINLNKKSPDFGRAVPLDMGKGNFPIVLERRDNYFENDPLFTSSTILFPDTNTYPAGSIDPDHNMMTFYERETNTLILRVLIPMEEESLYAVVLTNRLIGENGQPVRSPFPYINHLNQTESLRPLIDILPRYGLTIDDVAFAWDFTTHSPTRDLVTLRKGLYGKGPFSYLSGQFPAQLSSVDPLNTFTDSSNYLLKPSKLLGQIKPLIDQLIYISPQELDYLLDPYEIYVDYFISGTYSSPNFLVDKDGMAAEGFPDDENEVFDIDPVSGRAIYGNSKINFMCSIPKAGPWGSAPFPVVIYTHGSGNFKLEALGFAGNLAKFGLATCAIDAFGHGVCLDSGLELFARGLMKSFGFEPLFDIMSPARARDLNNDGMCESGGDFWTADVFHTRDVVRQTIVDEIQLIRIIRGFDGKKKWNFDLNDDGVRELAGDFNSDGIPDIGGPNADYFAFGTSLGGILSAVLAGTEPAITAVAPNAGGAGLIDITARSVQGGAVEAIFLRVMGPFLTGTPISPDVTELKFLVPDVNRLQELPFYHVNGIKEGDKIVLTNLRSGESDEAIATQSSCHPAKSGPCFRINFAADGARAGDVRVKLGITLKDTKDPEFLEDGKEIKNPLNFGDQLLIKIKDGATGGVKQTIDTFGQDVVFQGGRFLEGTKLVAPFEGFGIWRSTPDMRKMMAISGIIIEPADPASYAPHFFLKPFDYTDVDPGIEMGTNLLDIVTVGDMNVPVNTEIALARIAGIIPLFQKDTIERHVKVSDTTVMTFSAYTRSQNQLLLDTYVIEGLERLNRWTDFKGGLLFDIDNLSEGVDFTNTNLRVVPRLDPPLRVTVNTKTGVSGMRIPYVWPTGRHAIDVPHPGEDFDINTYMINAVGLYFQSRGKEIIDAPCLEMTGRYGAPCPFGPQGP